MALEGKRIVLLVAIALNLLALLCLIISYVTPYWVISWPRVYSGFKRIGLWEACFAGQVLDRDPTQKAYHGCWWILSPELYAIRDWTMPGWFVVVQIFMTVCVVLELINIIFMIIVLMRTSGMDKSGMTKRRAPFNYVQAITIITIVTAVLKSASALIFALAFKYDYFWMPNPTLNYLHVSYGLALLSAIIAIFASMALCVYRGIVRKEYQLPGSVTHRAPPLAPY